ncbi:MAG TPA: endo-1,4-beta-xylanase [Natronosporangium sp.]|nr:endo-1,4-beta-xylanase [Natronosporangium sp.]
MELAHRPAWRWLVVPLAAVMTAAFSFAAPASAQSTLRQAAADDFLIGVAVSNSWLNNSTFANLAATHFSSVTAENEMKWETTEPSQNSFNFSPGDQIVNFARQNNQHVYGHTLVWHSQAPGWVQGLNGTAMDAAMQNHITRLMQHWSDDIQRWDVVNEAVSDNNGQLRNSFLLNAMGPQFIENALTYARAANPSATLCLNDYSIDGINTKSNAYFTMVQDFIQRGVPIDCMGFQAHLILGQVPGNMLQNLQRFASLGLEIWVTELDIRIPRPVSQQNLQQQANDYQQVVQICQQANCDGLTIWGLHDAQSWVDSTFPEFDSPLLWDDNFQPKPAFNAVLNQLGGGGGGPGPTPPAPPTNLTANAGSNSVSLSWNGSSGATQYQVHRALGASGGSFSQIGTTSGTSFTDNNVSPNTTYRYRVTASNANGTSDPSNTVTVTTSGSGGPTTPPPGGADCAVTYVANDWGGHPGFTADITIRNTGNTTINGWTLTFSYTAGQTIEPPGWNGTVSQSGSTVTAVNASWNGTIPPNGTANVGFNGTAASVGNNPPPTSFSLNGTSCTVS